MISKRLIVEEYGEVTELASGVLRFGVGIGNHEDWYYLRNRRGQTSLVVHIEREQHDEFANALISACDHVLNHRTTLPVKFPIHVQSECGFDAVLAVPPSYHGIFAGTLDDHRKNVVLCIPIHTEEFSGDESEDEFRLIHFRTNMFNWQRAPQPKCSAQFDNPKTGSGTEGAEFVLLNIPFLCEEVTETNGVRDGFILLKNYLGDICEIRSSKRNQYLISSIHGSQKVTTDEALDFVRCFLRKQVSQW